MKMKIKIDVDEVLRDTLPILCDINNEITGEHKTVEDITEYNVNNVFPKIKEITGKDASEVFFIDNIKRIFEDSPAFEGAKEAIDIMHNLGHKILIVTWQPTFEAKIATLNWFKKNNIYYDDIYFTRDKNGIKGDILIDDNPEFLKAEENSFRVCIARPYNYNEDGNGYNYRIDSILKFANMLDKIYY